MSASAMETGTVTSDAALRTAMVSQILTWQPMSESVADAMRKVPRHLFVPEVSLAEAYTDDTVVTRRDEDGIPTSSASGPWLVGLMLGQLQVHPGQRVLEIGAGTGYNAALLAKLVGPAGHVTTAEIIPDVAEDARKALASAGVANVDVICGDGEYGHMPNAPYDRVIVTAGVWEIPPAWADQLAPGGVLVIPLRMKGFTRSVAFALDGGVWCSRSAHMCGFMPVQGDGAMPERNIRVADDMILRFDDGRDLDSVALARAAAGPGAVQWSGVQIDEPLDLLDYWLADIDGFCRVLAGPAVVERGLAEPVNGWGSMGTATAVALGYLTKRPSPGHPYLLELGACAYGPAARASVDELTERIHRWDRARRTITGVVIEVHPAGKGETDDALMVVDKNRTRIVVRACEGSASLEPAQDGTHLKG